MKCRDSNGREKTTAPQSCLFLLLRSCATDASALSWSSREKWTRKKSNYMKHFTSGSSEKLITLSDVTCGDFAEGRATVV